MARCMARCIPLRRLQAKREGDPGALERAGLPLALRQRCIVTRSTNTTTTTTATTTTATATATTTNTPASEHL